MAEAPGFAVEIAPGSVTFVDGTHEGCITSTLVHVDKVPMTPNFGQQPRFVVTLQPAGAVFDPPARLTIPNVDGLHPGEVTEMYSFNHDLGQFVSIGTGTVSDNGLAITSDPGAGVIQAGWTCAGPPSAAGTCEIVQVTIIGPSTIFLPPGNNETYTAQGIPSGGTYRWESDNTDVLTVPTGTSSSQSVAATPKAPGTARITVIYTAESGVEAASPPKEVTVVPVEIKLELDGPITVSDEDGVYSEDAVIRVTAVNANDGSTLTDFKGDVIIIESTDTGPPIYQQNGGSLEQLAKIETAGTTTVIAKSIAGPTDLLGLIQSHFQQKLLLAISICFQLQKGISI